jgi:Zn-finger nucleic acid-binding protein
MKCPVCKEPDLTMSERQGIEIDYCPKCRGVWLDRGELDKLIERSAPEPQRPTHAEERSVRRDYDEGRDDYYRRRKKKGFLGEIFDFD